MVEFSTASLLAFPQIASAASLSHAITMASKLIQAGSHEAENETVVTLREAHTLLHHRLKPPFSLSILSPPEYLQLNRAIAYGLLTQPQLSKTHFTHLVAIITDGYQVFVNLLLNIAVELYPKLLDSVRVQLLWVCKKLVNVSAIGVENLLLSLMRQITGGDFSNANLWLAMELIQILSGNWDWVSSEPLLLTSALFTYLRLLADHYRLPSPEFDQLKHSEIEFCIRALRDCFSLCFRIGRDLIRLLQDLVHIPEFRDVWKDLLSNPTAFGVPGFSDISQIYGSRTSSRYLLLRVTPEMEMQLRFLLTYVKWGNQKRYQVWFAKKFLYMPDRETIICDLVRFICCAHHPSNEIIQSNIIPRWAIVGWLLKCCRKNHVEANAKLALFYDWLFFDENVDNIMNIEPAILLLMHSIPKYVDITYSLLEFLFLLVDNYDINRRDIIVHGVSASFDIILRKGVVHSFEKLISCSTLSPFIKERLYTFIQGLKPEVVRDKLADLAPLSLLESGKASFKDSGLFNCQRENGLQKEPVEPSTRVLDSIITNTSITSKKRKISVTARSVSHLESSFKESMKQGLNALEDLLYSYATVDNQACDAAVGGCSDSSSEASAFQIMEALKPTGYEMFCPLKCPSEGMDYDDEIQSATALVIRTYIFCPQAKTKEMIYFWFKKGHPVGPRILSYVSRLAYEAHIVSRLRNSKNFQSHIDQNSCDADLSNGDCMTGNNESNSDKEINLRASLLKCHVNGYISFMSTREKNSPYSIVSTNTLDVKLVSQLVEDAFSSYRSYLKLCSMKQQPLSNMGNSTGVCQMDDCPNVFVTQGVEGTDQALLMSLFSDLKSCCRWQMKRSKSLFHSIFCHLPDLSVAKEDFVRLLVDQLGHSDLVATQLDVGLKRFSIFGKDAVTICHLARNTLAWDFVEQQKFWDLLISELAMPSKDQVDKIVLNLCSGFLDPREDSVAVGGLLTLCRCSSPTPQLIGTIMSLSNAFGDFGATVLANWVSTNSSMLFNSLGEWLQKLNNTYDGSVSDPVVAKINFSVIMGLLNFLDAEEMESTESLNALSGKIALVKAKLADIMVACDSQILQNS